MLSQGAIELKDWVRRRFDTQAAAAEFLGLSESELSMFLNGHRTPDRDKAVAIQGHAGVLVGAWSLSSVDKSRQPAVVGAANPKNHKA